MIKNVLQTMIRCDKLISYQRNKMEKANRNDSDFRF